jgi:hypothetical protein
VSIGGAVVSFQLSVASCQLSVVSCQLSVASFQWIKRAKKALHRNRDTFAIIWPDEVVFTRYSGDLLAILGGY